MLLVPLWLDLALLFWFSALLFFTSDCLLFLLLQCDYWWLWMQLLCLLSWEWSLFLWINKLVLLPLCSCLFVFMVHLHVSFGNTADGHSVLGLELADCVSDSFVHYTRLSGILSFFSCSCKCHFLLMLCLVVMAGFKVGGGEAVLAQDQPGTSRKGILH